LSWVAAWWLITYFTGGCREDLELGHRAHRFGDLVTVGSDQSPRRRSRLLRCVARWGVRTR